MTNGNGPSVVGFDHTEAGIGDIDRWSELARRTLVAEQVTDGRIDLLFVDVDEMASLNEVHMGHHGPTDVLSFPLDSDAAVVAGSGSEDLDFGDLAPEDLDFGDLAPEGVGRPVGRHLGDIVLCPKVAERQAPDHCGTLEAELSLLIIHGVLHILGHDHAEPEETAIMQDRERIHMANYGFDHPELR